MGANHWMTAAISAGLLGAGTAEVEARGAVTITFTTAPAPVATYSPNNVLAVWIEGPGGTFVKTIDRQSLARTVALVAWRAKAGAADVDAVSNATRIGHNAPVTVTWNLADKQNQIVPDATYTIRLEVSESNAAAAGNNNQGTFTFVKSATPQTQTGLAGGGFSNVTINFDPNAPACGDGIVDGAETCDGDCPATCEGADACMPAIKMGSAAMCNVQCVPQEPITACNNGDGCCAAGCEAVDNDCLQDDGDSSGSGSGTGNGATSDDITGGCATDGSSTGGLVVLGASLSALVLRRRRSSSGRPGSTSGAAR